MNKYSGRLVWLLIGVILVGLGIAEILIRGEVPQNKPIGVFSFWVDDFFNVPISSVFNCYVLSSVLTQLIFVLCLWRVTSENLSQTWVLILMSVQLLIVLLNLSELSYLFAAQLSVMLVWKNAWKFLLMQIALLAWVKCYFLMKVDVTNTINILGIEIFFAIAEQILPFTAGYLALKEKRTRLQLSDAHKKLKESQTLLIESICIAERLRIEEELQDVIRQQLMVLNVHLDVAMQQSNAPISDEVHETLKLARQSASTLLSQVRAVISNKE